MSLTPFLRSQRGVFCSAVANQNILLVESPAKAKKIQEYVGSDFKVLASFGHIRDLSPHEGSVVPQEDFKMKWVSQEAVEARLADIISAAKKSNRVFLATDPDREGEAISWHLLQELQHQGGIAEASVDRITFTEVTKSAVLAALSSPRKVNEELVRAYFARRALDYLYGFSLSPLLWRKVPGAKSAGRVQSVALRIVCERENAIELFVPTPYFTVSAEFSQQGELSDYASAVVANLVQMDGEPVPQPGFLNQQRAIDAVHRLEKSYFQISNVTKKQVERTPNPPYTTSTLQQDAYNRLNRSVMKTMAVAQALYEGGHITYMRTDGVFINDEAARGLRNVASETFGPRSIPPSPRMYKSKVKNAQEAHEAIRPTDPSATGEDLAAKGFDKSAVALYNLIRSRALQSQMSNANIEQVAVEFTSEDETLVLRATASRVIFAGWMAAARSTPVVDGEDSINLDSSGFVATNWLKSMEPGMPAYIRSAEKNDHETRPPPRYSEASLIKALEEGGIGRPSTYAPIVKLLKDRKYVQSRGSGRSALEATPLGRVLSAFLTAYFPQYVDYSFTANLENQLDEISGGRAEWKSVLSEWWTPFEERINHMKNVSGTDVINELNRLLEHHIFKLPGAAGLPNQVPATDHSTCPECQSPLSLKLSTKGSPFVGCTKYPECTYARPFTPAHAITNGDELEDTKIALQKYKMKYGTRYLGDDPKTGKAVFACKGLFGPYIQLGIDSDVDKRRIPIHKDSKSHKLSLDYAVSLLSLPKHLGEHPTTGDPIIVKGGKFGPYLSCGDLNRSVPIEFDAATLSLDQAVELLLKKASVTNKTKNATAAALTRGMKGSKGRKMKEGEGEVSKSSGWSFYLSSYKSPEGCTARQRTSLAGADWRKLNLKEKVAWGEQAAQQNVKEARVKEP